MFVVGLGVVVISFGMVVGGNKFFIKYCIYFFRLFKFSFRKCIFLVMFVFLVFNLVFYNFIILCGKFISFLGKI